LLKKIAMTLRERSHDARMRLLLSAIEPAAGDKVLDLGSGWWSPFSLRLKRAVDVSLTLTDISAPTELPAQDVRVVVLREDEPLPFENGEFELVICNSVIEHATLKKEDCRSRVLSSDDWKSLAFKQQKRFADEIRRVGRSYFVQTPHRNFPLDMHMWLPFTNWVPHEQLRRALPIVNRYWIKSNEVVDWNLLGPAEMQQLFPEATIHVERLFGLPKSVVAYFRDPQF
jgi:hypothetical protein